jgi:hypothetical protein
VVPAPAKIAGAGHPQSWWRRRLKASATRPVFKIVGGDGVERTLIQLPGEVNGVAGRFEYIVDQAGNLTHEMFVEGGCIKWSANKTMIPKPIPIKSVTDLPSLAWSDIAFGYSKQFLGWRTVVEIAAKKVEEGRTGPEILELASIDKSETWRVGKLLQRLAAEEHPESASSVCGKWLFILLQWLYENRQRFSDPLQEVEEVYADFGYPEAIAGFVRFLPPSDGYNPEVHTREENLQRLYRHWAEYLERSVRHFSKENLRRNISREPGDIQDQRDSGE